MHPKEVGDDGVTHEMVPEVKSAGGVTWTPSTTSFEILSTARDMATVMNRDASAR